MKKEHLSFGLGIFLFFVAILFSPASLKQDYHDQLPTSIVKSALFQMTPAEQQLEGNSLHQLLQRSWEVIKNNTSFISFYRYTKQLNPQLLPNYCFNQFLNDKVSLSIWVQCFRN